VLPIADAPDRHGRIPALVVGADGTLLQAALARDGLALAFAAGGRVPCFEAILAAEDEARRNRRGFWATASVAPADPEALASRIGRFVIFEGTVVSVGSRARTTYVDFGKVWSKDVTAEIAAKDRAAFGDAAAIEALSGARLRLRGFLAEKSGPMLPLRSPLQIETLAPATKSGPVPP
jgi:hypothetical protein